jgi:hypothetical protein
MDLRRRTMGKHPRRKRAVDGNRQHRSSVKNGELRMMKIIIISNVCRDGACPVPTTPAPLP